MAIGLGIAAVAAAGAAAYEQHSAAQAQSSALAIQSKVATLQYQQKTIQNQGNMLDMIGADEALGSSRGYTVGSASANAIERNNFNVGALEQQNLNTEHSLGDLNINNEQTNVSNTMWAQMFGDASSAARGAYGYSESMPSSEF